MSVHELDAARAAVGIGSSDPWPPDDEVDEALGKGEQAEFPLGTIEGDAKTVKNLIKSGLPITVEASLTSAKVPMTGGLADPDKAGRVMVSHEAAKYLLIPQREGEPGSKKIVGWTIRCQLRSTYVEPGAAFYSREQVLTILERVGISRSADVVPSLLGLEQ
jgi:hypothetical protein